MSTLEHTVKLQKLENKNGKKNNCMDISGDKFGRFDARWPGHDLEAIYWETLNQIKTKFIGECPRGVMVKSDGLRNRSKRVRTPVTLLRLLSSKYPWERYESPYPPGYGLNSTTIVLLGE